jgi:uncharacterized protein (UPF0332 family)
MDLSHQLLRHARSLIVRKGKPGQANLRRAISASYYALFHLLIADAVRTVVPADPPHLRPLAARAFQHGDMKEVCAEIVKTPVTKKMQGVFTSNISPELRAVCNSFLELQDDRHEADYNVGRSFAQSDALKSLSSSEAAFLAWDTLQRNTEGTIFLTALVFHKRWNR